MNKQDYLGRKFNNTAYRKNNIGKPNKKSFTPIPGNKNEYSDKIKIKPTK